MEHGSPGRVEASLESEGAPPPPPPMAHDIALGPQALAPEQPAAPVRIAEHAAAGRQPAAASPLQEESQAALPQDMARIATEADVTPHSETTPSKDREEGEAAGEAEEEDGYLEPHKPAPAVTEPHLLDYQEEQLITVDHALTMEEVAAYGKQMANLDAEIIHQQTEKKQSNNDYNERIKRRETERRRMSAIVKGQKETREVSTYRVRNLTTGRMEWIGKGNRRVIQTRPLTQDERFIPLYPTPIPEDGIVEDGVFEDGVVLLEFTPDAAPVEEDDDQADEEIVTLQGAFTVCDYDGVLFIDAHGRAVLLPLPAVLAIKDAQGQELNPATLEEDAAITITAPKAIAMDFGAWPSPDMPEAVVPEAVVPEAPVHDDAPIQPAQVVNAYTYDEEPEGLAPTDCPGDHAIITAVLTGVQPDFLGFADHADPIWIHRRDIRPIYNGAQLPDDAAIGDEVSICVRAKAAQSFHEILKEEGLADVSQ